ncbi:MAG: L-threonylcarbamoyladenylate synthase [Bacilli bacterium]
MWTTVWHVDKNATIPQLYPQLTAASEHLKNGETVAFPTETVYGLGADATNESAVRKIYTAKGRPSDNPLIVHIASEQMLANLVQEGAVTPMVQKLIDTFWPGPLTLVLPKKEHVAPTVTAGLGTVAVRMPNHPVALALIETAGVGVAAPSANLSGKPSPTRAAHVYADLNGRISGIVDGGETGVGVESTVLDCTTEPFTILRPGGVTEEHIASVVGSVISETNVTEKHEAPKSPGMKYTHYAPQAPLTLVYGPAVTFDKTIDCYEQNGDCVAVLACTEDIERHREKLYYDLGSQTDLQAVAQRLYDGLRAFDETPATRIVARAFPRADIGVAIMNRLEKASTDTVGQD